MAQNSSTDGLPTTDFITPDPGVLLDSCRVCMARSATMWPIFDDPNSSVAEKVLYCTGILFTKNDGLPSQLCSTCLEELSTAHRFKAICLQSNTTFHTILAQATMCVKTEPADFDYNFPVDDYNDVKEQICQIFIDAYKDEPKNGRIKVKRKKVKKSSEKYSNNIEDELKSQDLPKRCKPKKLKDKTKPKLPDSKLLLCESCGITFSSKVESEEHRKAFHYEEKIYICEFCGQSFNHASSHYSHVRAHLPQRYKCEHCSYMSNSKQDLAKHLRIHAGIKPYHCESCPTSYYTLSNLKDHIRRKHETPLRRFPCPVCDKRFIDRAKLNRHIDAHNDVKRFACPVCQTRFSRRCYWKKHLEQKHSIVIPRQRPGRQRLMDKDRGLVSVDTTRDDEKSMIYYRALSLVDYPVDSKHAL